MKVVSASTQGFSLSELVLLLSIIGLTAGITVPSFLRQRDNASLNGANTILSSWLDDQRRKAIQNSSPCDITINTSDLSATSTCDFESPAADTINLRSEIEKGSELSLSIIQPTTISNPILSFSPRGTTQSTIELRLGLDGSQAEDRCLRVNEPLGLIRTARSTSGGICDYTTRY